MNGLEDMCFLSGWAGVRSLFPRLGALQDFYVPFSPLGERELRDIFSTRTQTRTLLAWSTGAHMVLSWGRDIWERFDTIVLVAPFFDFTRYMPSRIIQKMQARLLEEGPDVLLEFYANCGITAPVSLAAEHLDLSRLIEGLEYLLASRCACLDRNHVGTTMHLVHGTHDRIVSARAFEEVCSAMPQAQVHHVASGHYVDEDILFSLVAGLVP